MKLITIDTAGPYQEPLGGSRYVIIFVDSASRLQRSYGTRDKRTPTVLIVVKHFVVDMGVPSAFWTENGSEYMNRTFGEYYYDLGIRRELTAPYTPQENPPVERALSKTMKAGLAVRLEVKQIFSGVHLKRVRTRGAELGQNCD